MNDDRHHRIGAPIEASGRRALAMFASRESPDVLIDALRSTLQAATGTVQVVDVLVNGNPDLRDVLVSRLRRASLDAAQLQLRVWDIPLGDKAHAWNQYFHHIWAGESLAFFIDGYVRPRPDALQLLGDAVLRDPHALGGSGVPSMGRSADELTRVMLREGGFHGNLCCIKGAVIQALRERQFRIPLGLYRTDALVGAVLSFNLDPTSNPWDGTRIHVHPQATWSLDEKRWWRLRDIQASFKRRLRQQRGLLENQAVKQHLAHERRRPEFLPGTVGELVSNWQIQQPEAAAAFVRRYPATRIVVREFRQPRDWSAAGVPPRCVWSRTMG